MAADIHIFHQMALTFFVSHKSHANKMTIHNLNRKIMKEKIELVAERM